MKFLDSTGKLIGKTIRMEILDREHAVDSNMIFYSVLFNRFEPIQFLKEKIYFVEGEFNPNDRFDVCGH